MIATKKTKIGDILIEKRLCTSKQIRYALQIQPQLQTKDLGTILLELAYVTKEQLEEALEEQRKNLLELQKSQN